MTSIDFDLNLVPRTRLEYSGNVQSTRNDDGRSNYLEEIPNSALRHVAWRVSLEYVIVMLIVIWLGNYMLTELGLSTHALTTTNSAALLFQGWPLITKGTKAEQGNTRINSDSPKNVDDLAVVPLLFPFSIGDGTIAVGISSAAPSNTIPEMLTLSAVIVMMAPRLL